MYSNRELWSERFERPYADLFAVQSEITRKVVSVLPGTITEAARREVAKCYPRNLEAYDYFVHGQALFLVRQIEDNDKALSSYRPSCSMVK